MNLARSHRLSEWIGRTEIIDDEMASFPVHALAATLNRLPAENIVPPLWHWLYFLGVPPLAETGRDGHAMRGGFYPPVELPRRMWAGGRVSFKADLEIGRPARKISTIKSIVEKNGRSGNLAFVTITHLITQCGREVIVDEQDVVYREDPAQSAAQTIDAPAREICDWEEQILPTSLMLFRYSALTFNGHRIHYDHPYAVEVEGYAGLVVHGPLIATLLADHAARHLRRFRSFAYRALSPAIVNEEIRLSGRAISNSEMSLSATDRQSRLIMSATALCDP